MRITLTYKWHGVKLGDKGGWFSGRPDAVSCYVKPQHTRSRTRQPIKCSWQLVSQRAVVKCRVCVCVHVSSGSLRRDVHIPMTMPFRVRCKLEQHTWACVHAYMWWHWRHAMFAPIGDVCAHSAYWDGTKAASTIHTTPQVSLAVCTLRPTSPAPASRCLCAHSEGTATHYINTYGVRVLCGSGNNDDDDADRKWPATELAGDSYGRVYRLSDQDFAILFGIHFFQNLVSYAICVSGMCIPPTLGAFKRTAVKANTHWDMLFMWMAFMGISRQIKSSQVSSAPVRDDDDVPSVPRAHGLLCVDVGVYMRFKFCQPRYSFVDQACRRSLLVLMSYPLAHSPGLEIVHTRTHDPAQVS